MPNLLDSTSVPVPQFASVSLLLNDQTVREGGGAQLGGGAGVDTAILVASPWATLPHRTALDCLDELHRHLSGLHPGGVGGNDGGDDGRKGGEVDGDSERGAVQVHRSRAGNGVGLHHLLVTDRSLVDRCSAVLLGGGADAASSSSSTKNGGSSSSSGGKKMAAGQERAPSERGKSSTAGARGGGANGAADNVVAGVVLCVAVSGSSHALHGPCSAVSSDSHLRLRESVPLLTRLLKQSLSTAAAASESAAASRGGSRGKRGGHKQRAGAGGDAGDAPTPSSAAAGQEQGRKWIRVLLASLLSDDDGGGSGADASSSPASASAPTRTRGSSPISAAASGGTSRHHHHHPSLSSEAGGASYFFRRTPRGGMPTTPPAGAGAAGADPGITTLTVVRAAAATTPRSAPRRHQPPQSSRHRHRRPRSTVRSNPADACRMEAERMQVLAVSDASGDMDFGFASEAAAGLALLRRRRAQGGGGRAGRRTAAAGLEAGPDGSFDYVPPPAPAPPPPPPPPIHSSPVGAMTAATFAAGPSPRTAGTGGGAARTIVFPPSPSSPSSPSPSPSSPASLRARLRRASSGGSASAASGRMAAAAPRWPSSSELSGGASGGGGGSFRRRAEQRRAQQVGAQAQPVRSGSASSLGGGGGGGKSDGSAAEAPAGPWTASFDGPATAAAGSGREDVVANGGDVRGEGRRRRRSGPGPGADGPGGDRGRGQGHPPSSLQRALRSSSSSPEPMTAAASSGVGGGSGVRRGGGEGRGGEGKGKGGRDGDGNKAAAVMTVSVALNEDLTCSYRRSKLVSLCIEGLVQVRASSTSASSRSGDDPDVVPFHLIMRDPLRHIRTVQESRAYVRDVTAEEEEGRRRRLRDGVGTDNGDAAQRTYVVTLPKRDQYFPVVKYKCGDELCPVPVRVQTKVKFQGGTHCRVALQISSNPVNRANLSDLTIVMGVPSPFLGGETLTTSPAGGVWDGERRQVSWCVAELGSGEKFQLQAQFGTRTIGGEDVDKDDVEFPVSVRCHCMYAQLSRVELGIRRADAAAATSSSSSSTDVKMKLARRYRISHRERS